jgi:hypothetical protein
MTLTSPPFRATPMRKMTRSQLKSIVAGLKQGQISFTILAKREA